MKSNAPKDYICPICLGNRGIQNDDTLIKQNDLVFRDYLVNVWINSFWIDGNEGHVIVVPNDHFENIYELPAEVGHRVFEVSKKMSLAIREVYNCDGITIRQNNEPAADQHAFHYHLHVFPRYENDGFNQKFIKRVGDKRLSDPSKRIEYANRLKNYLKTRTYIY